MVVTVAVAVAGAVDDHRVVEQVAVAFLDGLQAVEEVGQLGGVEDVDVFDLRQLHRIVAVVGDAVVAVAHADERVRTVGAFVGQDERRHAGRVGLEREDHEVGQEAQVFLVAFRDAPGLEDADGQLGLAGHAGFLDAHFHLAHRREVFVELALVVGAEAHVELAEIFAHRVEDRLALRVATLALQVGARAEEPLEDQLRVHFLGHRLRGRAPGDVGLVDAGVARVAAAGQLAGFGADLEGGQARAVAEAGRGELVGRDAGADVGAVGLAGLGAGEEGRHRAGVVAAAVAVGAGLVGGEAGEHREVGLVRREGREDRRQLGRQGAFGADAPAVHVHAVGDVQDRHAVRRGLLRGRVAGGPGSLDAHRLEPRQGHDGAQSFEDRAAMEEVGGHGEVLTS